MMSGVDGSIVTHAATSVIPTERELSNYPAKKRHQSYGKVCFLAPLSPKQVSID
jgi:hypothetical protein